MGECIDKITIPAPPREAVFKIRIFHGYVKEDNEVVFNKEQPKKIVVIDWEDWLKFTDMAGQVISFEIKPCLKEPVSL